MQEYQIEILSVLNILLNERKLWLLPSLSRLRVYQAPGFLVHALVQAPALMYGFAELHTDLQVMPLKTG